MTELVIEDAPDRTIPEDTVCSAVLLEVKEDVVKYTDKKTGEPAEFTKLNWWFEVVSGEHEGRKVRGETDAKASNHPRNRVRAWSEVILNRDLSVGTRFTTEDLLGLPCQIRIGHRLDRKDPSKVYEFVADLLPEDADDTPPF